MEFIDKNGKPAKVDETDIKKIWNKMKGDRDKFAEAVFAEYTDVFRSITLIVRTNKLAV